MWYGDKREAKVMIMHELVKKGWKVYGYKEDQSDSMSDYYDPASWDGIAEKNGYVLVVDNYNTYYSGKEIKKYNPNYVQVDNKQFKKLQALANDAGATEGEKAAALAGIERLQAKYGKQERYIVIGKYPTFSFGNPGKCSWHIEKDGQIIAKGTGVFTVNDYDWQDKTRTPEQQKKEKLDALINRIEKALRDADALEAEVIKVPKTVTKAVEIDKKSVSANDFAIGFTFVMKVNYTHGNSKGTKYQCTHVYDDKNSAVFSKLGKSGKPSKAIGNGWFMTVEKMNAMLEKGHIAIIEMQQVTEYEDKVVYKKTARKQKPNMEAAAIVGEVEEVAEVTTETAKSVTGATYSLNEEKNGIEIKFTEKPSHAVIDSLKAQGFRWSSYSSLWWAKLSAERLAFAKSLCEVVAEEEIKETTSEAKETHNSKPEINPDELIVEILADSLTSYIIACGKPETDDEKEKANKYILGYMIEREIKPTEKVLEIMKAGYPLLYSIVTHTKKEVNEQSNVIYYDFGKVEAKEEETETENMTDDILSAFDNIEIENESRIAAIDLEFCQEQEAIYKKLLSAYNSFSEVLQGIRELSKQHGEKFQQKNNGYTYNQESAMYYSLNAKEINEYIIKMKNKFISSVSYYFMNKYNVTIDYEKIQKKFDANVTHENIIDEIFIELGGFNFTEKAEQEIKDNLKNELRGYKTAKNKNNKLSLENFLYIDSSWKQWGTEKIHYSSEDKLKKLFEALQHFEDQSITMNEKMLVLYNQLARGKNEEVFEKHEINNTKVKSIRIFKNGKVEIEFTSTQQAMAFTREYCGTAA
jgi:hypothetical protein